MISNRLEDRPEHFCTLFDSKFLPMGISLHSSLMQHAQPFHLWILCMDEIVEQQLNELALPNVTPIPLNEVETEALLAVKSGRSRGEYCWTLTPFTFQAIFERNLQVTQLTYLDADLFFFDNPQILIREFEGSGKHVLITEHAYAPDYDKTLESGRFCVQFLTFKKTANALKVMHWWQDRCIEWCFARSEDGKFGDQKYLDRWPEIFPNDIYIIQQTEKTLAPWNVKFMREKVGSQLQPVFYHFHGLRLIAPDRVSLYFRYKIGKEGICFYKSYTKTLIESLKTMKSLNIKIPYIPPPKESLSILRYIKRSICQEIKVENLNLEL